MIKPCGNFACNDHTLTITMENATHKPRNILCTFATLYKSFNLQQKKGALSA
jgi:hypothetical protein